MSTSPLDLLAAPFTGGASLVTKAGSKAGNAVGGFANKLLNPAIPNVGAPPTAPDPNNSENTIKAQRQAAEQAAQRQGRASTLGAGGSPLSTSMTTPFSAARTLLGA